MTPNLKEHHPFMSCLSCVYRTLNQIPSLSITHFTKSPIGLILTKFFNCPNFSQSSNSPHQTSFICVPEPVQHITTPQKLSLVKIQFTMCSNFPFTLLFENSWIWFKLDEKTDPVSYRGSMWTCLNLWIGLKCLESHNLKIIFHFKFEFSKSSNQWSLLFLLVQIACVYLF